LIVEYKVLKFLTDKCNEVLQIFPGNKSWQMVINQLSEFNISVGHQRTSFRKIFYKF